MTAALVGIISACSFGAAIAWAGSSHGISYQGIPVFILCGLFAYVTQWLMFVHAWVFRTERYYDLTGSATFVVLLWVALFLCAATDIRSITLAVLITVWAVRLGSFLFRRIQRSGEDRRFRSIKNSFLTFLMTWTLQGAWVFVTASCALAAITAQSDVPVGFSFVAGLGLWIFGFSIEVVADWQKSAFRARPQNSNQFINSGLWAWSRHPNYFGEIVLWSGIAVMALPALTGWQLATLVSPLFVLVLLTAVSGVRLLEARAQKLWGQEPAYKAYKRQTPALMLWPPTGRGSGASESI